MGKKDNRKKWVIVNANIGKKIVHENDSLPAFSEIIKKVVTREACWDYNCWNTEVDRPVEVILNWKDDTEHISLTCELSKAMRDDGTFSDKLLEKVLSNRDFIELLQRKPRLEWISQNRLTALEYALSIYDGGHKLPNGYDYRLMGSIETKQSAVLDLESMTATATVAGDVNETVVLPLESVLIKREYAPRSKPYTIHAEWCGGRPVPNPSLSAVVDITGYNRTVKDRYTLIATHPAKNIMVEYIPDVTHTNGFDDDTPFHDIARSYIGVYRQREGFGNTDLVLLDRSDKGVSRFSSKGTGKFLSQDDLDRCMVDYISEIVPELVVGGIAETTVKSFRRLGGGYGHVVSAVIGGEKKTCRFSHPIAAPINKCVMLKWERDENGDLFPLGWDRNIVQQTQTEGEK